MCGLDSTVSRQVAMSGSGKHGRKPSGTIKGREILDQLSDH
jgi:hypothetical protein